MDTYTALSQFISQQRDNVKGELTIDTENRRLYHISPNPNIHVFTPREIQRTMPGEDETINRVCTGITLIDCLRGYAVALRDYLDKKAHCAGKDEWLGGYTIYALDVEGSLRPSKVLAPIAEWSEERWLVDYLNPAQKYPAKPIGKCFIDDVYVDRGDNHQQIETSVIVEVNTEKLVFSPFFVLKRGYYRLHVPGLEKYKEIPMDQTQITLSTLSESEFNQAKTRQASLLSYDLKNQISRW